MSVGARRRGGMQASINTWESTAGQKYTLFSLVRNSYCDIIILQPSSCLISPNPPPGSRETTLSVKISFRHRFMSSLKRSTADAMKPSISKGDHLGSVNSSLVNLYLTPPFPSLSPSCVTLSSRLSAGPYPFIKAQLTCLHRFLGGF